MFHATVNNIPVPAIVRHIGHVYETWVEVDAAEQALGINYVSSDYPVSDPRNGGEESGYWGTPQGDHKGYLFDHKLYAPWNELAKGIQAHKISNGWEFDVFQNVVTATPVVMPDDDVIFSSDVGQSDMTQWQLDTGAFEPLVGAQTASLLNLPNLGSAQIEGVGGTVSDTYNSMIPSITIGETTFKNVPCVVDPSWTDTNLFGWRFFEDNGYGLVVDRDNFTLDIIK